MRRAKTFFKKQPVESRDYSSKDDYETWYYQTMPKLYRFVYSRLQNHADTEDITQETYTRCLKSKRFGESLIPYPYLIETAKNLIFDRYRFFKVHNSRPLDLRTDEIITIDDDVTTKAYIQALLNKLPSEHQLVLQLRIVEGYSRKETAERMGCSENAVRGLQYRAIQTLRDIIHKEREDEHGKISGDRT